MKKIILILAVLPFIFSVGCSVKSSESKDYLSKETVEIPKKGKLTVINKGFSSKDFENKLVFKLLFKDEILPEEGLAIELNKADKSAYTIVSHGSDGDYSAYYAIFNKDDKQPLTFKISNEKNEVLFERLYYPVDNPDLEFGLDPELLSE